LDGIASKNGLTSKIGLAVVVQLQDHLNDYTFGEN
jgi:hypothetical protein